MAMPTALLRSDARDALPARARVLATLASVVALHIVGVLLLLSAAPAVGALVAVGVVAYGRGLVHALDFDHVSMIDNSIRSFVARGTRPVSVGLAFATGHSTVVVITSALVVAGASAVLPALDATSPAARVLGIVGLAVSGTYLLLCACGNLPRLVDAVKARRAFTARPEAAPEEGSPASLGPTGPLARLLQAPLRRITRPLHVYALGFVFSLGFDTSSQIALLVLLASASISGIPPIALMSVPILFAAAMTLVDTANGMFMVRLYSATARVRRRELTWNIVITVIGIVSAVIVAALAFSELAGEVGIDAAHVIASSVDTQHAGFALVGIFAVIGVFIMVQRRRTDRSAG